MVHDFVQSIRILNEGARQLQLRPPRPVSCWGSAATADPDCMPS